MTKMCILSSCADELRKCFIATHLLSGTRSTNLSIAHESPHASVSLSLGCLGSEMVFAFSDSCAACSSLSLSISSTSSRRPRSTRGCHSCHRSRSLVLFSNLLRASGLQRHHQSNSFLPHKIRNMQLLFLPEVISCLHVDNARLVLCEAKHDRDLTFLVSFPPAHVHVSPRLGSDVSWTLICGTHFRLVTHSTAPLSTTASSVIHLLRLVFSTT